MTHEACQDGADGDKARGDGAHGNGVHGDGERGNGTCRDEVHGDKRTRQVGMW